MYVCNVWYQTFYFMWYGLILFNQDTYKKNETLYIDINITPCL